MKCVCVWLGAAWVETGLVDNGLGLGFTTPVRTKGMLDVCLFLGCGGVDGVDGEWVGDWTMVWRGVVVLCLCEMLVWIICVDGRSRYLCFVLGGYLRI